MKWSLGVGLTLLIGLQVAASIRFGAEVVQGNVAALTLIASYVFIAMFMREPWWRTWFGRSLMLIAVALFLDSLATVLYRWFGEYPGRPFLLIIAADTALAAMVIRAIVLRAKQRDDDRGQR